MAVMLVARGQGLIAVISPIKKAATSGTPLIPIVCMNPIMSISAPYASCCSRTALRYCEYASLSPSMYQGVTSSCA